MLRYYFSFLVFLTSLRKVKSAAIAISEVYFRQTEGNQPSAYVELFNSGGNIRASNYQLCYGNDYKCMQLHDGLWRKDTYFVLCSDITFHPHCRQSLSFILSGVISLEIRNIYWTLLDNIELEKEAILGASYQRFELSTNNLIPIAIQSPGSGYLGGPSVAPMASNRGIDQEDLTLFFNEYNVAEGWVEIGHYCNCDFGSCYIGDFVLAIYDPATGKKIYASRISNANFTLGIEMNGMTIFVIYNIPQYGEQFNGVLLIGNGFVWDAISYSSSFIAQDGPGRGVMFQSLPYLHGMRTGEGCDYTALPWIEAPFNTDLTENPNQIFTCNGDRSPESKGASPIFLQNIIPGWSYQPTIAPTFSAAPSYSPTVNICAQNVCGTNAECKKVRNDAGYICICKTGYQMMGANCTDINECSQGTHNCHELADCNNTIGSFTCKCKDGYWGNAVTNCADYPECKLKGKKKVCNREDSVTEESGVPRGNKGREVCVELVGSYRCDCKDGFYRDYGTNQCLDKDECEDDPCGAGFHCINEYKTFKCLAITGVPSSKPTP